jgi:dihydroflavonol-4-reductase
MLQIRATAQEVVGIRSPAIVVPFSLAGLVARWAERFYSLTRTTPRFTSYALRTVRDNSVFSHAKARRELGYDPRSLRRSIADTVAWWGEHEPGAVPAA